MSVVGVGPGRFVLFLAGRAVCGQGSLRSPSSYTGRQGPLGQDAGSRHTGEAMP